VPLNVFVIGIATAGLVHRLVQVHKNGRVEQLIRGLAMATDVIDFQTRRAAREAERAAYDAHHKRVVAIFKIMAPVIACAQELGADNQAIAGALRAIVEELEEVQSGPPDAAS
jgi:hypothetical protein